MRPLPATAEPPVRQPAVEGPRLVAEPAVPALRLAGVAKRWRRGQPPVLGYIDLNLAPGTATWIGGQNGAGKTTLLRIAAGLIAADEGSVRLHGLDVERQRRRYHARVGFLSAGSTGLYSRLTTRHHLGFWARLAFVPRRRRRGAVERSLERFDLHELADRRVDRMSMGQRQRLRLAMAFLHDPEVVLLDEPHTSLDEEGARLLELASEEVLDRGGAILACGPTGEPGGRGFDRRLELRGGRLEVLP